MYRCARTYGSWAPGAAPGAFTVASRPAAIWSRLAQEVAFWLQPHTGPQSNRSSGLRPQATLPSTVDAVEHQDTVRAAGVGAHIAGRTRQHYQLGHVQGTGAGPDFLPASQRSTTIPLAGLSPWRNDCRRGRRGRRIERCNSRRRLCPASHCTWAEVGAVATAWPVPLWGNGCYWPRRTDHRWSPRSTLRQSRYQLRAQLPGRR